MASAMDSMTEWMNAHVAPLAGKLGQNRVIQAISNGMMMSMPLTIGVAAIAIIINLPIPGLSDWLAASGLTAVATELINSTMSLMAIYISWLIAYQYAKGDGTNPITAGVLSMASFLILVPSTITLGEEETLSAFQQSYLGSNGIFVAIILSIAVSAFYGFLTRKNIKLTLPDSVPPMVSDSLSPCFTSMIIFGIMLLIKWGFTFTSFGNVFDFVSQIIAAPLMNVGGSPVTLVLMFTLMNLVWFFGVHPNSILSVYIPILIACGMQNTEAFMAGQPLPNYLFGVLYPCIYFGGQGNTIGLCINMWRAKSEKFKAMRGLMTIPNIFNINEPVIFGVPVMLNPIFFVPMVLAAIVPGIVGAVLCSIITVPFNPSIQMPWAMPTFISAFITGGPVFMLIVLACMASSVLLYAPFFTIADNQAYEEEQAIAAQKAAEQA